MFSLSSARSTTTKKLSKIMESLYQLKKSKSQKKEKSPTNSAEINDSSLKRNLRPSKKPTFAYEDFDTRLPNNKGSKGLNDNAKKCLSLIQKLKRHSAADPFLRPVDPVTLGIPDYLNVIKKPMDLGTVEKNLKNEAYSNSSQLASDIRLIWSNAFRYNPKDSDIYHMTVDMSQHFEQLFQDMENLSFTDAQSEPRKKVKPPENKSHVVENSHRVKSKAPSSQNSEKQMTYQEKKTLVQNIRILPAEYLRGVWEIVSEGNPSLKNQEELEFDIDTLPLKKARELEKYVRAKLLTINKKKKTQKTSENAPANKQPTQSAKPVNEPKEIKSKEKKETEGSHTTATFIQEPPETNYSPPIQQPLGLMKKQDDNDNMKSSESSFLDESDETDSDNNKQ